MSKSPDKAVSHTDPGDEMQRRVRYQAVKAACYILALFDDDEAIDEVFCEQHEDILVKYRTGLFRGVQVKTKLDGAVPHKAGDEEVVNSLRRFISIEKEYPGYFDGFVLATNCGFWKEVKNGSNLSHLLDEAHGKALGDVPNAVLTYLSKLCPKPKPKPKKPKTPLKSGANPSTGTDTGVATTPPAPTPEETHEDQHLRALAVFQKLRLDHTPSMEEMEHLVVIALSKCPVVGKVHLLTDLEAVAKTLIGEILEASAKPHTSAKKLYFAICKEPETAATDSVIDGKRFARSRVEQVIRRGFGAATALRPEGKFCPTALPKGTRAQQAKMTAGGIVIDDVSEALQQRLAAEFAITSWLTKYGRPQAYAQYQDVRSAVLTPATRPARPCSGRASLTARRCWRR